MDNPRMRFYGTLKFNGYVVGKGYGANKKQVKQVAARVALMNLVPSLYREWKALHEPQGSPSLSASSSNNSTSTPEALRIPSPGSSLDKLKENVVPKRLFNETSVGKELAQAEQA